MCIDEKDLPTPYPTPVPTEFSDDSVNRTSMITDEITVYGYNSNNTDSTNPQPVWVVSLNEYLWGAECTFNDELIDSGSGVNDTQFCRPDLKGLYDKCLMTYRENTEGSIIEDGSDDGEELDRRRNAQIETLVSSVDKLCIYRSMDGNRTGFLQPIDGRSNNISVELGVEKKLKLEFEMAEDTNNRFVMFAAVSK